MRGPVSIRCRLIGTALRRYREQAGCSIADAARLLDCDRSKISRIEAGTRGISAKEVRILLDEYAADPGGREALEALASAGAVRGWWDDYRALLTHGYRDIMATEHAAGSIAIYAPVGIPELLHAEEYARAFAAVSGQLTPAVQDIAVAVAMARQRAILYARPINPYHRRFGRGRLAAAARRSYGTPCPAWPPCRVGCQPPARHDPTPAADRQLACGGGQRNVFHAPVQPGTCAHAGVG
jgi:transcriptional regulator with XRE-family HTH domain